MRRVVILFAGLAAIMLVFAAYVGLSHSVRAWFSEPFQESTETAQEATLAAKHAEIALPAELAPGDVQPLAAIPYTDDFEGPWPGSWQESGDLLWDRVDCNFHSPTHSASASGDPTCTTYYNDQFSWLVYGPFDLSGATAAGVDFWFDLDTEGGYDWLYAGASTDENNYCAFGLSGYSAGWMNSYPGFAPWDFADPNCPVLGEPQVWFAFIFTSDFIYTYPGAWVDDVNIWCLGCDGGGPPNNNLDDAFSIPSIPYSNSQSTVGATSQAGEPDGCGIADTTVWYKFAASTTQPVTADTFGSNYDTTLNVYSGPASAVFADLALVDCNDDSGGTLQSEVSFTTTPGTTYYLQIDGFAAATGDLVLNLSGGCDPPPNDDFDDAIVAEPQPFSHSEDTSCATLAPDDPPISCVFDYEHSVWFDKTPPAGICIAVETFGSNYDTVLAVYTGPRGSLTEVTCNDDSGSLQSRVVFEADGGTTYHIMVASYDGAPGGNLEFYAYEADPAECVPGCTLVGPTTVVAGGLPPLALTVEQPPVAIPRRLPEIGVRSKEAMGRLTPAVPEANVVASGLGGEPQPYGPNIVGPSFDGLDYDDNPFGVVPPDPQVAVGPSHVFEMVNVSGRIFDKSGGVVKDFTLRDFFALPSALDLDTDPKVIYDDLSDRWFASYLASDLSTTGAVYFAASQTSDPTGAWNVYHCDYQGVIPDYPGIGLTNDKFTVSSNLFDLPTLGFMAEHTFVVEKADIMAGLPAAPDVYTNLAYQPLRFTVRPAHTLTPKNDQNLAWFDAFDASLLCLSKITGTPNAGNVVEQPANCVGIQPQWPPPPSLTAGGGQIDSGDWRALEAVWRNDHMWVSASAECIPPGDGNARSCAHLIEVETVSFSMLNDIMFGAPGEYFSWPAIRTDSQGNLHVSLTHANSSIWAEAAVVGRLATAPPNTMDGWSVLRPGQVLHDSGRWGDYMGAAVDPADPSYVWVVGQYAKDTGFSGDTGNWDWGTYIGRLRYEAIECRLRMEANPPEGGTTDPPPGDHWYPCGGPEDIEAYPNPGWEFCGWTGDPDCADGHVTVDHDMTCTANFSTECPEVTVRMWPPEAEVPENGTAPVRLEVLGVPDPGLGTYVIDVSYDPSIVMPADCVPDPDGVIFSPYCHKDYAPGVVRCGGFEPEAGLTGQVALCDIIFEPMGEVCQTSDLLISVVEFYLQNSVAPPLNIEHGSIHISSACGDADCNGSVQMLDAMMTAQYVMGLRCGGDVCDDPGPDQCVYLPAADVDRNGLVQMLDAMVIAQCVMGLIDCDCDCPWPCP